MKRIRNVKIIATIGPASSSPEMIERLFKAGADVFRINMSHSDHQALKQRHAIIRRLETENNHPIGILVDLQGPKLRIGTFKQDQVTIRALDTFVFDDNPDPGDETRVHLPHPEIFSAIEPGDHLLLNDGRLRVEATRIESGRIETRVIFGGELSARKGVNLPDTVIPLAALTEKDRADLEYACELGIDWIALSFVQRPEDVAEGRKLVRGRAGIMAKMEKPSGLNELDAIVSLSDSIMVARGDLGVELPIESVPAWQKKLISAARRAGKPVVVATQMLESMIDEPVPTRAEVSDVANAVFEGADAIMLSAESAMGAWPEKAVAMMDRIAQAVEHEEAHRTLIHAEDTIPEPTSADAIAAAARTVADTLNLAAIVCYTGSGSTGLRVARERPEVPILALTPIPATGRRLALVWGLHCILTEDARDLDDMVSRACRIALESGYAQPGERIIITAGVPLGTPGATNMLRIAYVGQFAKTDQQASLL